jgi:hypothetical protein
MGLRDACKGVGRISGPVVWLDEVEWNIVNGNRDWIKSNLQFRPNEVYGPNGSNSSKRRMHLSRVGMKPKVEGSSSLHQG